MTTLVHRLPYKEGAKARYQSTLRMYMIEDWALDPKILGSAKWLPLLAQTTKLAFDRQDAIEVDHAGLPTRQCPLVWPILPAEREELARILAAYPPGEWAREKAPKVLRAIDDPPPDAPFSRGLPARPQEDEVAFGLLCACRYLARQERS